MKHRIAIQPLVVLLVALLLGCSGGGGPVTPPDGLQSPDGGSGGSVTGRDFSQAHAWGYYDVYLDAEEETISAVMNRQATFAANVVSFINGKPDNLEFDLISTLVGSGYVDADINVRLSHPLPGLHEYDGYDVMGVLDHASDKTWNDFGDTNFDARIDHSMRDDPFNKDGGGPDGYTRWFNASEFPTPGLFGYTHGSFAIKGYTPGATLRPYRYFADGIGSHEDLWDFLIANTGSHGVFTSGATNTRNYYVRFFTPNPGVKFGYTVVARWEGEGPGFHPANAREAVACSVTVTDDVYYVSSSDNGGSLILDISVFDWSSEIEDTGAMEDYVLRVESTVLSSAYEFSASDMTPTGGGEHYSTYHVEIPADNVTGTQGNEFWVIAEYPGYDYKNDYGVPNQANDPLSAYFRRGLYVSSGPVNQDPICDVVVVTPMPLEGWAPIEVEFNALASYDPEGNPLTFSWDFDDDGVFGDPYDSGSPGNPTKAYMSPHIGDVCVRVSDGDGGESECCVPVSIGSYPSKNIPVRSGVDPYDIAVDPADGDLLVLYSDGQVWRHRENDYYHSGSHFYTTTAGYNRIDISPNGYSIVGGSGVGSVYARTYNDVGSPVATHTGHYSPCGAISCVEVIGYNSPLYYNNHGVVMGCYTGGICLNGLVTYLAPGYDQEWTFNTGYPGYVPVRLVIDLVKGCERSVYTESYVYYIETGPEFRVERYNEVGFTFGGVAWGGTQTDYMHGFNDPRDITRDNDNDYYILDYTSSGFPVVKKYDLLGNPIGSFGNAVVVSGDPLRIEGGDYNGNIFVLHSDGISLFFPEDMP